MTLPTSPALTCTFIGNVSLVRVLTEPSTEVFTLNGKDPKGDAFGLAEMEFLEEMTSDPPMGRPFRMR